MILCTTTGKFCVMGFKCTFFPLNLFVSTFKANLQKKVQAQIAGYENTKQELTNYLKGFPG